MNEAQLMHMATGAMIMTAKLALPILLVSLVVGLVISLFQSVTQIQEVTLTFVPKLVASPWSSWSPATGCSASSSPTSTHCSARPATCSAVERPWWSLSVDPSGCWPSSWPSSGPWPGCSSSRRSRNRRRADDRPDRDRRGLASWPCPRSPHSHIPTDTAGLIGAVVLQVFTGAALGLSVQILLSAVTAAGSMVDLFGGIDLPPSVDPLSAEPDAR